MGKKGVRIENREMGVEREDKELGAGVGCDISRTRRTVRRNMPERERVLQEIMCVS